MFQKLFTQVIIPIIILVAGVVFLILGIGNVQKRNDYPTTTAVITKIETHEAINEDDSSDTDVYVEYMVNGKKYSNELGEYVASFTEGATIEIYYNPQNPDEIFSASMVFPIVFIVAGGIMCLISVFFVIKFIVLLVMLRR
ncbi:MAG: DUF3592 domain-containing protein [Clostridia bacterium]|nr:DUF3592 domain-containing protein [Clostridia bacterium]